MNQLGIITINHGRPRVLELWCAMIKRLMVQTHTYIPAVVVSDKEDAQTCIAYKVAHIPWGNRPVSQKFNVAMKYMQMVEPKAVMILGSDDIISTDFYYATLEQVNKDIDYIGINRLYFYCGDGKDKGKMVRLDHRKTLGTARTVSRSVLQQCDWKLWTEDKNWGMDAMATKTIVKYAKSKAIVEGMVVDVKTRQNLNHFSIWGRRLPQVDPQEFYKELSEEELQILKSL